MAIPDGPDALIRAILAQDGRHQGFGHRVRQRLRGGRQGRSRERDGVPVGAQVRDAEGTVKNQASVILSKRVSATARGPS
jgi:hypothetical protein